MPLKKAATGFEDEALLPDVEFAAAADEFEVV